MRIPSISSKITRLIENRKFQKEQKFLNKYVSIDTTLESDTFNQLYRARKTIANYAKAKGVTVEITDAEKKVAKETFEYDIDENTANKMASGNLEITVRPLKPIKTSSDNNHLIAYSQLVSKDTTKTYIHTIPDYIVIDYPDDGIQQVRLTKHEFEDNFIRNIYRKIEDCVKHLKNQK